MMNSQHEIVTFNVEYIPFVSDQHRDAPVPEIPIGMWSGVGILGKSGKYRDEFTCGCNSALYNRSKKMPLLIE